MKRSISVEFPLYKNDKKTCENIEFTNLQKKTINAFFKKLETREYRTKENKCICGNKYPERDIIITEKDRYGIPYQVKLCSNCGLLYPTKYLDEDSLKEFYKKQYRKIYSWGTKTKDEDIENLFGIQEIQGNKIINILLERNLLPETYMQILEIGSACGGNLLAFKNFGLNVIGCDFETDYIEYGKQKGLNLRSGDLESLNLPSESQDIILLYHVLEHMINPLEEIKKILLKLKTGGILIIGVPSVFSIKDRYYEPLKYFQNAHVYSFTKENLEAIIKCFNMKILYSNDEVLLIAQKQNNTKKDINIKKYLKYNKTKPEEILDFLSEAYIGWEFSKNLVHKLKESNRNLILFKNALMETKERLRITKGQNLKLQNLFSEINKSPWFKVTKKKGMKKFFI